MSTEATGAPSGIRDLARLAPDDSPRRGAPIRAELRRFTSRRLIGVLLLAALAGGVALVIGQWVNHTKPTAAAYVAAQAQHDRTLAEITADCRAHMPPPPPPGTDAPDFDPCTGISVGSVDNFLPHQPFDGSRVVDGLIAVGGGLALLGFVIGATFAGAEWSTKNIVALLFWEPRRIRVLGSKLAALLAAMVAAAVVGTALWLGAGALLLHFRGVATGTGGDFWRDAFAMGGRAVGLTAITAAIGFAIANLTRNTGATLGVAFVYLALAETLIRHFRPGWGGYLLLNNVSGWLNNGGIQVETGHHYFTGTMNGNYFSNAWMPEYLHLTTPRAGLTLLVYVAVLLGLAGLAFRRRDVA